MNNFFNKYYPYVVAFLLAIMFFLEVSSAIQESQTIDEGVHLAAGYSYWKKRDFRMNAEHPPLLKLIAAWPLWPLHLKSPFDAQSWRQPDEWQFAKDFIYDNYISADTILLLSRLPMMLLSCLLGFFIFFWSKKLFGLWPALFSLTLYVFDPNIIAHSRYVTTDLGVTLFFLMSVYFFGRYLDKPSSGRLITAGIMFGLAQASKFSAVILLPVFIILYLIKWWQFKNLFSFKKLIKSFLVILLMTAGIILVVYGFELKKPIDDWRINDLYGKQEDILNSESIAEQHPGIQSIIHFTNLSTESGKLIHKFLVNVPVPAYSYFKGLIQLESHNAGGHMAYLMGHYSNYGWWYYFPVAFLVKTPISIFVFLIFIIISFLRLLIKQFKYNAPEKNILSRLKLFFKNLPFYVYLLVLPPLIYFLWSLTSRINIGWRHILIVYPFIFIILGYLIKIRWKKYNLHSTTDSQEIKLLDKMSKGQGEISQSYSHETVVLCLIYKIIIILHLLFYIFSSLSIYPHFLAYFNEIAGGASNGPKYLTDSNIDWGQAVKNLKKYMLNNKIDYVCLSYFGQAKLEYYQIDYRYLPDRENFHGTNELNCVVAISVTSLYSEDKAYSWLFNYQPTAKIGYSIYIYDFRK